MKRNPHLNREEAILDGANGKLTHVEANEIADNLMRHLFDGEEAEPLQTDCRSHKAVKAYHRAESICFWLSRLRPLDYVLMLFFLLGVVMIAYCLLLS